MEHQTFTFIVNFDYELMAHELAHQWFGDHVTCGSFEDIWLNEGFATYLSGLCYEHLLPFYWMPFKQNNINSITSQPGGSVLCTDTTSLNRIFDGRLSYDKGAMILHTLRWVIGDSAFYAGIRNYRNDMMLSYGFAKTPQLKFHLEQSSGQNLTWYFDDWYSGEGFPSYNIQWTQDGSNQVSLTVNQTQSHPSVSFFELPIPIRFKNQTQDTLIVFDHTFSGETFTASLNFQADSLIFDPELWIISANNLITAVKEIEHPVFLKAFPNPLTGRTTIHSSIRLDDATLSLENALGQTVKELRDVNGQSVDLSCDDLADGLYFARLTQNNRILATIRLVVAGN